MTRTKQQGARSSAPTVDELLEQRSRILGWLARLDEVEDAEDRRVVERVRADYQQRLRGVVEELAVHLEVLRGELDGARGRSGAAEERHSEAADALREARLRHRIGEIADEEWESRRSALEAEVSSSAAEREEAAAEVSRLAEVLAQIEEGVQDPREAPPPAPDADLPDAETAPIAEETFLEPVREEEGMDQDLAFLEELDRAIAASAELTDPEEEYEEEEEEDEEGLGAEEEVDTRPRKGMKCLECGYTNDVTAWYCGVCGVELP